MSFLNRATASFHLDRLVPWKRSSYASTIADVHTFTNGWGPEVAAFEPAALAATRTQLLELAAAGNRPRLTHALIVLSRRGEPLLSAADRDLLWRAFRVPLFQQMIGLDGELLAAECEAHDGLHVDPELSDVNVLFDCYRLERTPCACGAKSPRLASMEVVERVRSAAVYAR